MNTTSAQLSPIYTLIGDELRQVEQLFDEELQCDLPFVNDMCAYIRRYRGKMLRPVLTLLSGRACGSLGREHITLAAVLEMVHMATLLHDDVLDHAEVRRSSPTVGSMTSNQTAVLLGDYLISHAYHLCSSLDSQYAARTIASCTNTVCEGELLQVSQRNNWRLTQDEYLSIVSRKTAALTSAACLLGAKYAGADARVQGALESYGMDTGIAFQIVDDILDLTASELQVGKSTGRDLAQGELTLPVIHVLQTAAPDRAADLRERWSAGRLNGADLQSILAPGVEYALGLARQRVRAAVSGLECLAASPAADALRFLAEFILRRKN
jgi:octaprenyl-diphosphate synthase